jgi:hypothetical protein
MEMRNCQISLTALFPPENCVGLSSLTMALLLMFPAMGTFVINLRQISAFFSSDVHRFKTTLCKLYQITLILGALEIVERTTMPCEVRIKPPFTRLVLDDQETNPFAIRNLLIQTNDYQQAINQRRAEFRSVCTAHARMPT